MIHSIISDPQLKAILLGIFCILILASAVGAFLSRTAKSESARSVINNLNARTQAWWVMIFFVTISILSGRLGTTLFFALISFLALREFITLTPTHRADHRTLFWAFFIINPLQYYFVWEQWYGTFSVFIPVYGFLIMPIRNALSGETKDYLSRTARVQWASMVCIYFVSYAPALLTLEIPGYEGENVKLLLYLIIVVQLSDVFQYVWGKLMGKRKIAPRLSPSKTVEGLIGGIGTAALIGTSLWWMTPFSVWQSFVFSILICIMGFFGGLVMSAIKRDHGIKDFGTLIKGHGGILDRIDSICFSAPLFFHLVRYYFAI